MRPGRTQTGMSSYRPPYIVFLLRLHETGLTMNLDRSDFVSVVGRRREILVPVLIRTGLM